jgi:predicted nucleic acid-binding Zn ribbon protein
MGVLLDAVRTQNKKIKLLDLTAEIPNEKLMHWYLCEGKDCMVDFGVSQMLEDQSVVTCPVCKTDDHLKDVGPAAVFKGVY